MNLANFFREFNFKKKMNKKLIKTKKIDVN